MNIRSRYFHEGTRQRVHFDDPSLALQSEKNGTMIDAYIAKYRATGFLGDPVVKAKAIYGDFTGIEDFQTIKTKMARITEVFEALPSNVRRFFGDEVGNYVAFVTDPRNLEKSIEMGLLTKEDVDATKVVQAQPEQAKPQQQTVKSEPETAAEK